MHSMARADLKETKYEKLHPLFNASRSHTRRLRLEKNYYGTYFLVTSVTRLGNLLDFGQLLRPLAKINLPNSPTFLGNF